MGKFTNKFKTLAEFNAVKNTLKYPFISIVEEENKIYFALEKDKVIVGILTDNKEIILDESLTDDNYIFKYEDSYNHIITNFKSFDFKSLKYINENIAPYRAEQIGVYTLNGEKVGVIELGDLKKDFGKRLYRFGVLSDVHHDNTYDKYYYTGGTGDKKEAAHDLANALNFLEKKEDICMTCCCGDITVQQGEVASPFIFSPWQESEPDSHLSDLDSFKYNLETIAETTPFFIARGNHDVGAIASVNDVELANRNCENKFELWKYYTYPKINAKWKDLGFSDLIQKSEWDYAHEYISEKMVEQKTESYYFTKENSNGLVDVFIFLSVNNNNFWYNNIPAYNTNEDSFTLDWYEEVLEKYRNNRCFVFTHLFPKDKSGNHGHHYYMNNGTWYYTDEYKKFNELNNHYKNAILITGHSHYKWNMQQYGGDCNVVSADTITLETCGYNVHIPSCAYPRIFDNTLDDGIESGINMYKESEGAIFDIYEDYVDVRGIVFKEENDETYTNKYEPMAQYRLYVGGKNLQKIESKVSTTNVYYEDGSYQEYNLQGEINDNNNNLLTRQIIDFNNATKVEIGRGVTSLNKAFYHCNKLTDVIVSNTVLCIGYMAFGNCGNLIKIEIPNSVTSFGDYSFYNCTKLNSIIYSGTKEEWRAISKGSNWNEFVPQNCIVYCNDGNMNI